MNIRRKVRYKLTNFFSEKMIKDCERYEMKKANIIQKLKTYFESPLYIKENTFDVINFHFGTNDKFSSKKKMVKQNENEDKVNYKKEKEVNDFEKILTEDELLVFNEDPEYFLKKTHKNAIKYIKYEYMIDRIHREDHFFNKNNKIHSLSSDTQYSHMQSLSQPNEDYYDYFEKIDNQVGYNQIKLKKKQFKIKKDQEKYLSNIRNFLNNMHYKICQLNKPIKYARPKIDDNKKNIEITFKHNAHLKYKTLSKILAKKKEKDDLFIKTYVDQIRNSYQK